MRQGVSLILFVILVHSINAQEIEENNKFNPNFTIAGRLMFDYGNFDYKNEPEASFTGTEIRRATLESFGELSKNIGFKFQIDFARTVFQFKEVHIYFKDIPVIGGRLTIGNVLVPFNLDKITSSKFITFMERATPASYMLTFKTGFMYENFNIWKNRIGFQIAYTANGEEIRGINYHLTEGQNLSSRLTINAFEKPSKNELLHLGISFTHKNPVKIDEAPDKVYAIAVRPEADMAKVSLFHVFHDVNNVLIGGFEAAYTIGSFSVQGEVVNAGISTENGKSFVPSYYGYVSYFLTGEHRPRSSKNAFGRVKPIKEFNFKDKWGAVELAARYSSFDLSTAGQGKLNDFTFGVNWYLTSYTRIMYNYIYSNNPGIETINMHMLRFQIDFARKF
jgi:phosphate-selective porin OprO/OprP